MLKAEHGTLGARCDPIGHITMTLTLHAVIHDFFECKKKEWQIFQR